MRRFKFSYDEENDDLFLYNPKSKGGVELGDIVLDFNNKKELVGLQMMNASRFLKEIMGESISRIRSVLMDLRECKVGVKVKGNLLIIKVYLFSRIKELSPVISVPNIRKTSPALAYT